MSAFRIGEHFFQKILVRYDKSCNFALTKKTRSSYKFHDPVVQLVRMPPCHGGGRGFESRPDREISQFFGRFFCIAKKYLVHILHSSELDVY